MLNLYSILIIFAVCKSSSLYATTNGSCHYLPTGQPPESSHSSICIEENSISINLPTAVHSFQKVQLRSIISKNIHHWAERHSALEPHHAYIYLNVPENNPDLALFKIEVIAEHSNFYFSLPLNQISRPLGDMSINVLGKSTYPSSFGYRSNSILVKKSPTISDAKFLENMTSLGAIKVHVDYHDWYQVNVEIFNEETFAQKINFLGKRNLGVVNYSFNHVYEWQAERVEIFNFSL